MSAKDAFVFTCDDLPEGGCRVLAFELRERLGAPFELTVHLDVHDDGLVSDERLGQLAKLAIGDRPVHGVIRRNELLVATEARRIHRLVLGPTFAALGDNLHSRVFVDKTIPEIIEDILGRHGIDPFELRLTGTYAARPQVTQYRESDLAFLQRWMEREGMTYFFVHDEGTTKLVITDDVERHDELPSGRVRFVVTDQDWGGDHLKSWSRTHAAATKEIELGDYDYLKPALELADKGESGAVGFESLVRFEDNLQDAAEVGHQLRVSSERERSAQVRFRGAGRVHGIFAGASFQLEEHPRGAFNQRYGTVAVRHRGCSLRGEPDLADELGVADYEDGFHVEVVALPKSVAYRAPRTAAWPRLGGVEHAFIDGEADGPYAQIDAEGRYRVRFPFDELDPEAGKGSALLRMLQPHGGAPESLHFPLRKGTEVLVAFVHGDPDRPYVVGAVPNPKTPSPVTSANHTLNVLQTGSRNRVEIDDEDGAQYIDVSTPPENTFVHLGAHAGLGSHNIVVSTDGDGLHHAGGNRDLTVGGNQTEDVTGNLTEEYASNQTTHVYGTFTETIDGGMQQTISAGASQMIDGGLKQTISGGHTRTVDGGQTETISGGRTQTINGATDETIGGSLVQTVAGGITITTPSTFTYTAPAGITLMTPAAGVMSGLGGLSVVAPGGQMTVDGEFFKIGEQHKFAYLLKLTAGTLRIGLTGLWLRRLANHFAIYGLKIDLKGVDDKDIASEKKFIGADIKAAGRKVIMKTLLQFD